jgi:hypothetical protein
LQALDDVLPARMVRLRDSRNERALHESPCAPVPAGVVRMSRYSTSAAAHSRAPIEA